MSKVQNISRAIDTLSTINKDEDLSKYGREFQIKLIALMMKDRIFSVSIMPIIKNEYFSDIYLRKIFVVVQKYVTKYSSCPEVDNIRILLHEAGEKTAVYDKILDTIHNVEFNDRQFVIDNAHNFCFSRYALAELEQVKADLVSGNFASAKARATDAFRHSGGETTRIFDFKTDYPKVFDSAMLHSPIPMPFKTFNDVTQGGPGKSNLVISVAPSNFGKCFAKGTKIRMYDMTLKNIEDIIVGDKVMGWDGKSRTVTSTATGQEEMFEIQQNNGNNYTVNGSHILCLKNTNDESKVEKITVFDYNKKSNSYKRVTRGFKVGIDFNDKDTEIDPYLLGLWLGDGFKKGPWICGVDSEIKGYLEEQCRLEGITLGETLDERTNVLTWKIAGENDFFRNFLKNKNLINNKHIPENFLYNSYDKRMSLLAGLIDTDGGLGVLKTSVELTQRLKSLSYEISVLCRSLGLRVTEKTKIIKGQEYYRLVISGKNLLDVPTIIARKKFVKLKTTKKELNTYINVVSKGIGDYYGFTLSEEADRMFLLEDFTVVHNTAALTAYARHANSLGKNVAFFSFEIGGVDIIRRYIAGLTDMKQEDVINNRKKIEERMSDEFLGNIKLIEERATNARISTIKTHLEYLKSMGFFFDMICIDSLNQLKLPVGMRYEGDNQKFEYLAEELRDLASEYEVPVHTVFQTNRSGFTQEINDIESIGKAIEPFQVADMVITYSQTKAMAAEKKCYALLLKNRLGPKFILLDCFYDPNMGIFDEVAVANELLLLSNSAKDKIRNTAEIMANKVRAGDFNKKS